MKRACIVTVDAARARIFLYQEQAKPGFELTEYRDLDNPGRRMKAGDMFSETRPGTVQQGGFKRGNPQGRPTSTFGNPGAAYDDHRDAHIMEMDAKFAKQIVVSIDEVLHEKKMGHLILIAAPKMLGTLRANNGVLHRPQLVLDEVSSDLSNLSLAQLHDHVAGLGMIPPRARLAVAR